MSNVEARLFTLMRAYSRQHATSRYRKRGCNLLTKIRVVSSLYNPAIQPIEVPAFAQPSTFAKPTADRTAGTAIGSTVQTSSAKPL